MDRLNQMNLVAKFFVVIFCLLTCHLCAGAKNTVFGYSGLILTPTADILQDGELTGNIGRLPKLYADHYAPYNRTSFMATIGFLPFLEASFGFVRPDNYQGGVGDRTVAIRVQFWRDKKYIPALALGFHDFFAIENLELEPVDAQHFAALYIVGSKHIPLPSLNSALVLNMGYGPNWLPAEDSHLLGWFWGLQYSPLEQVDLLLEFDSQHYNAGIRYIFFSCLKYTMSFWQLQYVMHQFSFSIHLK